MDERVEVREEDDALLLVGIGTGQDDVGGCLAAIDGDMGKSGGDVEEIARAADFLHFEVLSGVHLDFVGADDENAGLMCFVVVGERASARRHDQ